MSWYRSGSSHNGLTTVERSTEMALMAQTEGNTLNRPSFFDRSNFMTWKKRMAIFVLAYDIEISKVIALGPKIAKRENGSLKKFDEYSDKDGKNTHINSRATQLLHCALNPEELNRISVYESAKEIWEILEVTHEGMIQVKEIKINMLLHDYELFSIKDDEAITNMLDHFSAITNFLASFGKPISSSNNAKKVLRSLPREWDATVMGIMESKDLNKLEFNALIGSLINYEILLKSRGSKSVPHAKFVAFRADSNDDDEIMENEDDEEIVLYVKNMRRYKSLIQKRSDNYCCRFSKPGHYAKYCRVNLKGQDDRFKKKEVIIASLSDDEDENERIEESNLALMALGSKESFNEDIRPRYMHSSWKSMKTQVY
ncbi:hypothetical protein OROMI_003699 [Orobanche minor]